MSDKDDYLPLVDDERFGLSAAYIHSGFVKAAKISEREGRTVSKILTNVAVKDDIKTIKVSNAHEFLEALGSNRIIEVEQGVYPLSEWDPYLGKVGGLKLANGISWSEAFDGGELILNGIKNLSIIGNNVEGGNPTILVSPRYAFVLKFVNCSDIVIKGMTAGHSEGGYCEGGVFGFKDSSRITISNVHMYGSGTVGLELINVSDMKVDGFSEIYECTYSIMTVEGGKNISFVECYFNDNKEFTLVDVSGTDNMSFDRCSFKNNRGEMFEVRGTTISVSNSTFSGNQTDIPIRNSQNVKFTNCTFEESSTASSGTPTPEQISAVPDVPDNELMPIIFTDEETGMTAQFYPGTDKENMLFYHNNRFGYSLFVPKVFTKVVLLPENEDGITLETEDGQYRFRTSGGHIMIDDQFAETFENAKTDIKENVDGAMIFEKTGSDWWQLTWWNGPEKGWRKWTTNGEVWSDCEITGPGQLRNAPGEYDELFDSVMESLDFPVG
jgi:hypothetical protein